MILNEIEGGRNSNFTPNNAEENDEKRLSVQKNATCGNYQNKNSLAQS